MIRVFKSIAVAFSMYSRIPMPRFEWGTEDMKYHLCFFPWVGAVIGILEYAWLRLAEYSGTGQTAFTALALAIPLLVTGGFHVDGYMDTTDALQSWKSRAERLEILQDPHIGAFAVIRLALYGLLMAAAVSEMTSAAFPVWLGAFFLSRALSGICVTTIPPAKETGIVHTSSETAAKRAVCGALSVQAVLCAIWILYISRRDTGSVCCGIAALAAMLLCTIYYRQMCRRKFGGITGDLAGWFVCASEFAAAVAVWIAVCALQQ